jgi:hypothetical protein
MAELADASVLCTTDADSILGVGVHRMFSYSVDVGIEFKYLGH